MRKIYYLILVISSMILLASCGGGGSGGTNNNAQSSISVSGLVTKSPVNSSNCLLYNSSNNVIAGPIKSQVDGSIDFGKVQGVTNSNTEYYYIECVGGTYVDEATGMNTTLTSLQTFVPLSTDNSFRYALITPLTHLAWLQSGKDPKKYLDAARNVAIAFGLSDVDITSTTPTNLNVSQAGNDPAGKYGVVLAAFSQYMKDVGTNNSSISLSDALNIFNAGLSGRSKFPLNLSLKLKAALNNLTRSTNTNGTIKNNINAAQNLQIANNIIFNSGGNPTPTILGKRLTSVSTLNIDGLYQLVSGGNGGKWEIIGTMLDNHSAIKINNQNCTYKGNPNASGELITDIDCSNVLIAENLTVTNLTVIINDKEYNQTINIVPAPLPLLNASISPSTVRLGYVAFTAGTSGAPIKITPVSNSTGKYTYSTSDDSSINIDSNGIVTLLPTAKIGSINITVFQAASPGQYQADTTNVTLTITNRAVPSVSFWGGDPITNGQIVLGASDSVLATTFDCPSEFMYAAKITYTSSNSDVAAFDPVKGFIKKKAGSTTITASVPQFSTCAEQSISYQLTITKARPLFTIDSSEVYLTSGGLNTKTATYNNGLKYGGNDDEYPSVSGIITYISSDPGVAIVSNTGLVTAIASGSATITATLTGIDSNYKTTLDDTTLSASYKVTVAPYNVSTIAGGGAPNNTTALGYMDGLGKNAMFASPKGIVADKFGNLFVTDYYNHRIRKITLEGVVTTFAGSGDFITNSGSFADGMANLARFNNPTGITIDANNNLYIADTGNNLIRKITPEGIVSTLAGGGGNNGVLSGFANGVGTAALFDKPYGIAIDNNGIIYISDAKNALIRKIDLSSRVTTLAGGGDSNITGFADGQGSIARFNSPSGLAIDISGNLYVADRNNQRIRKIDSMANVTTIAGGWWGSKYVSGKGTDVELVYPTGITVDAIGNVYFTDQGQTLIRKITPMGALSTIAGSLYMVPNFADGPSNRAIFSFSEGVTVNSIGDLYVADSGNNLIRKISSSPP